MAWQDHYDDAMEHFEHPGPEQRDERRASARIYADNASSPQHEYTLMDAAADVPLPIYLAFGLFALMVLSHGHLPPALDLAIARITANLHAFLATR